MVPMMVAALDDIDGRDELHKKGCQGMAMIRVVRGSGDLEGESIGGSAWCRNRLVLNGGGMMASCGGGGGRNGDGDGNIFGVTDTSLQISYPFCLSGYCHKRGDYRCLRWRQWYVW